MQTNTQEAVLSAYIASIGKRMPREAAQHAAELCRLANSLNPLNEFGGRETAIQVDDLPSAGAQAYSWQQNRGLCTARGGVP